MPAVAEQSNTYLEAFEAQAEARRAEPAWLVERRDRGMQQFGEKGFPTTKHEEYRYTNLAPIAKMPFQVAGGTAVGVTLHDIEPFLYNEIKGDRLVFVNGCFTPSLSSIDSALGGTVTSIRSLLEDEPSTIEPHLARYSTERDNALAALNSALFCDGAVVRIPAHEAWDAPVHLVFVSTANAPDTATHPRVLIVAERDSEAAVIETHCGLGDLPYWTNAVTEIVAADNARLDHYRLQQESVSAFHTSLVEIHQGRDANVTTHSVSFGGGLVRNDVEVVLEDENSECTMNGLYAVNGRQHVDNRTCVDHTKPHCSSHQLYKGILDGHSRGVFGGKIIVRPDAQKTDAFQSNKNLLLSEDADVNTKPQLEIDANDVKCSHGATIGQIDDEALFYLRSRGIREPEARSLLTYAFAADLLERMKFEPIRERFESLLMTRLVRPEGK
jgi:Fe-S cluster assembly protein SufD